MGIKFFTSFLPAHGKQFISDIVANIYYNIQR